MSCVWRVLFFFNIVIICCDGQSDTSLPLSSDSFRQIKRMKMTVPEGRSASLDDVIFRFYGKNSTDPTSYRVGEASRLLDDPAFELKKPTVIFAHGYISLTTDESVLTVVRAYLQAGGYNVLALDWANLGFGNYLAVALDLKPIGVETAEALAALLKAGLALEGLHLVGHSMGVHLLAFTARHLKAQGYTVPRLTGLDPAFPGFYPPLLSAAITADDAAFVDIIHTDAGGYGAPVSTGDADFWPNQGRAKQPGCPAVTVPLLLEDFCSHWRSWVFWAESVTGGEFLALRCDDQDTFLRGRCDNQTLVHMGLQASTELEGNFYLKTAASPPYALAERGTD